jgi:hypothetical protein
MLERLYHQKIIISSEPATLNHFTLSQLNKLQSNVTLKNTLFARYKHSSIFWQKVNYQRKSFIGQTLVSPSVYVDVDVEVAATLRITTFSLMTFSITTFLGIMVKDAKMV